MKFFPIQRRRMATTMVELLLFLAFFAVVGGAVVTILFATNDQRVRQQVIASVERAGRQTLQALQWRIERAERVLDPMTGATGSVLALQMAEENEDPFILAQENGTLVMVRRETKSALTPEGIIVSDFVVRTTSPSADRPGVFLSFVIAQRYPLPSAAIAQYEQYFEMLVLPLPDDELNGGGCGCAAPVCQSGTYRWQVCTGTSCSDAAVAVPCT